MNILFYYPSNKRAVGFDTIFVELQKRGPQIYLLTTCEEGLLHKDARKLGVHVFAHPVPDSNPVLYQVKQVAYLVSFCKKHQIDFVFSHLQPANIIAVAAQYFMKAKVVVFRHHFRFDVYTQDVKVEHNRNEIIGDKIVNALTRKMIVPSSGVYNGMRDHENVDINKVSIIPYMYDFSKYKKPDSVRVREIRAEFTSRLLLIMVSRFVPLKRHLLAFNTVKKLVHEGLDIKMILLDDGPDKEQMQHFVKEHNLQNNIFFIGYTTEIMNYMAAANMLIHPSLTEASNSVAKEMGMLEKAIAVCEGVGDFSEYVINGVNGYLMPTNNTEKYLEEAIREAYANPEQLKGMGYELRKTVEDRFGVSENILALYDKLLIKE